MKSLEMAATVRKREILRENGFNNLQTLKMLEKCCSNNILFRSNIFGCMNTSEKVTSLLMKMNSVA